MNIAINAEDSREPDSFVSLSAELVEDSIEKSLIVGPRAPFDPPHRRRADRLRVTYVSRLTSATYNKNLSRQKLQKKCARLAGTTIRTEAFDVLTSENKTG